MKAASSIFTNQNLWLKLLILILALTLGFDAKIKQLLLLSALFLLYFLVDPPIYLKLFTALKRILTFMTAYWVFASLFGTAFPIMVHFSMQIFYFLLISVYCLGTVDTQHFMLDTRQIQHFGLIQKASYVLLATALFIRSYFSLLQDYKMDKSAGLNTVFAGFAEVIRRNYAHAMEVEKQVEESFENSGYRRRFLDDSNMLGLMFTGCLVILGAM